MVMSNGAGNNKKRTKGQQKIEKKKIEDPNSRQVTFSKRRTGLFKKAAEICVLTGAQIAIVVSSPGGRVYAFRHPKTDVLIDRYLNNDNKVATAISNTEPETETTKNNQPPLPINEFNQHYVELSRAVEAEKKRRETIPASSGWYDEPVNGMNVEELQAYLCSLGELKNRVLTRADELMMINKSGAFFNSNTYEMGLNKNNIIPPASISTNTAISGSIPCRFLVLPFSDDLEFCRSSSSPTNPTTSSSIEQSLLRLNSGSPFPISNFKSLLRLNSRYTSLISGSPFPISDFKSLLSDFGISISDFRFQVTASTEFQHFFNFDFLVSDSGSLLHIFTFVAANMSNVEAINLSGDEGAVEISKPFVAAASGSKAAPGNTQRKVNKMLVLV
ncbi:hypothetical protein LXL04_033083 [Taraxacum kok-saghyz]